MPPRKVLVATWLAFGIAVAAGAYLIALVGWELLAIGAASILAGVLYTGGPRPYGYEGLGEVFVFTFFGLVAVVGSYYVQTEELTALAFALGVPVGLLSAAILMVNNIRDIDTDRRAGKRTLAVRLGRRRAIAVFAATLCAGVRLDARPRGRRGGAVAGAAAAGRAAGPAAARAPSPTRTDGPALNGALARTGMLLARLLAAAVRRPAARLLMKIERLEVVPYALPFKEPYVTARGRLDRRELLLVRLHADGLVGLGEAAPLALRGGSTLAEIAAELDRCRDVVVGATGRALTRGELPGVSPQARLAIELALLGPARQGGRGAGCTSCSRRSGRPVRCNATLVAGAPDDVAAKAREWADRGFETFKLKAGVDGDVEQVRAVRDAVPDDARIRVDANGTWSVDEAAARLEAMGPLELAEQPVATLDDMRALRARTDTRLAADESVVTVDGCACGGGGLRRGDGEAREGRQRAHRVRDRARAARVPVERARRAGRHRGGRARGAGAARRSSRTASRPRCCSPTRSPRGSASWRAGISTSPAVPASASRSTRPRSRAAGSTSVSVPLRWTRPTATPPSPPRSRRSWRAPACATPACRRDRARRRSRSRCGTSPAIRVWSHVDERSAGFFALGIAQETGAPAVVVTTSGTAGANVHPAVAEAHEARVPLIVMTADRPPELRGRGAGQTIDQLKLFGDAVRWFCELGVAAADDTGLLHYRSSGGAGRGRGARAPARARCT